jgi:hypothetical protein
MWAAEARHFRVQRIRREPTPLPMTAGRSSTGYPVTSPSRRS